MDGGSPARPVRRRAHVCRVCDSTFTCKAELLEHEQEVHTSTSVSMPPAKRRSVVAKSGDADSAGPSPIMLQTPAKTSSVPGVTLVVANLPVDHEEVYESRSTIKAGLVAVQRKAPISMQPKVVPSAAGSGGGGTDGARKQASIISTENRQSSSSHAVAGSHEQLGSQSAESRSMSVPAASLVSQSTSSPSTHPHQGANVTAAQNRGPLTISTASSAICSSPSQQSNQGARATAVQNRDPVSGAASSAVTVNKSPAGNVIQVLGLQREGAQTEAATASTVKPGVDADDTKPPVSDSIIDVCGSAVDSRHLTTYEVLGTINAEPRTGSDGAVRNSRDVGIQVSPTLPTMPLPAMTKEEATDCVAGLHQGQSYAAPVNNDELQLLAAVSSTRSRDIVTQPEKVPSPVPAAQEPVEQPEEMTDVVVPDVTDIVEQEVVLETTVCESVPRKKRSSASRLPVNLYELPMTPHEFTAADGAKKRMVAITVAPRAPRMVSVLLRNRSGTEETQEQQESSAEANVEQASEKQTEEEGKEANAETPTDADVEPETAASIAAEAATAAQAIAVENEADSVFSKRGAGNQVVQLMMEECLYCQQPFPSHELAEHITLNHVCDQCGRKFRQPANLRKHVKINHENEKPHHCPVCNKAFPYASYLSEHLPVHDASGEERRFSCEHCNKSFVRASGLRKHTKEEHLDGPKPFVCEFCDRRYAYRCALEGHLRKHSALRPFSCQSCGAGFKHISNLQKHVKTQHPEPCSECGDTKASCEHAQAARAAHKTKHRCTRCGRHFESSAALQVHERVHTGEKPEVCETCGRAFQHRSNLQKHMMKHAGRRPHACTQCPRAFYARHSLMAHMRKHTGDSPYHCDTCGKRFCTKNGLQVHMNLHNNVRPFSCDICGRRFAQLGNLQKHMSVHTGERPHQCPECSRSFSDVSAMRRHCAAIHEREARYGCDACGKKFLHLSSARSHRMQHDGRKPHYCRVCGKTFTHRSGWLRHCRSHKHNTDTDGAPADDSKEVVLKPGEYIVYLTE